MLPTVGSGEAQFIGRIGEDSTVKTGRMAAYLAAVNALAVARQQFGIGSTTFRDRPARRVGATSGESGTAKIADGASELLRTFSGKQKPTRLVYGVASFPLGVPVEPGLIFEVSAYPPRWHENPAHR